MKKGRLTKQEQTRRLKLLLEFIFIFRYATRYQLFEFSRQVIGLTYPRWLVDYARKIGLIRAYYASIFKVKIYYLTKKGKDFIYEEEALIKHYRFEKRHAGANSFPKHNLLVDMYLKLNKHIEVKLMNWGSEWILRIGKKKREKLPDGLFVLPCGAKIAVELEVEHEKIAFLKNLVYRCRYDVEKSSRYNAVLIVISCQGCYERLKKKLFIIAPDFYQKALIFADLNMLEQGLCFYKDEIKPIKEIMVYRR